MKNGIYPEGYAVTRKKTNADRIRSMTDEELAARPMTPVTRQREVSKSLKAYASMVSSADKGAVRLID